MKQTPSSLPRHRKKHIDEIPTHGNHSHPIGDNQPLNSLSITTFSDSLLQWNLDRERGDP